MKNKKIITFVLAYIMLSVSFTLPAHATSGSFKHDNNGYWYQYDDGSYAAGKFEQIGSIWYLFGDDGYRKTGWQQYNGKWYYLYPANGAMAHDTTISGYDLGSDGAWIATIKLTQSEIEDIIKNKFKELRVKFPSGKYWNHMGMNPCTPNCSDIVTDIPCNHSLNGTNYCNNPSHGGMQCAGFATKMGEEISQAVYGKFKYPSLYSYDYNKIKIGDIIRYNDSHSVFVIDKTNDYISVAECNADSHCGISWDRKISKDFLDKSSLVCETLY